MKAPLPLTQLLVWTALVLLPLQALLLTQSMAYNSAAWLHYFAEHNLHAYRVAADQGAWCMTAAIAVFAIEGIALLGAVTLLRSKSMPAQVSVQ